MAIALSSIMPQLQHAQMLHQQGRIGEAWTTLAPIRMAIDSHGQALRLYALVAQSAGRLDEAIAALERIITLERGPPEIIGALADMLGKAGRHEEALDQWGRLVGSHPAIADAHLNRAVTAANAGRPDLSLEAADAGLKRFPGHARLTATKAMALKNLGRIEESVALFELAVAADPDRALTRHNQAVALRAACRFDEACEAYKASERLGMKGAQFHANWAAAALEAGQVDEAADLYRKALAEDAGNQEALKALTRLQIEYRGGQDAFAHYAESAARRGTVEAWSEWIQEVASNKRFEEAAAVGAQALERFPGNAAITAITAFGAGMSGDAGSALDKIDALPPAELASPLMMIARAQLALRAGRPELAAEMAERFVKSDPGSQIGWSLLGVAWRVLGDPREQWLCDYDRLVMVTEVPSPDGSLSPADFAREVAAALDPLHQTNAAPGNQSLREGTQTSGQLFDWPIPAIQRFRDAVRMAAENEVAKLPDDPEHPFLRRKSANLDFSGSWSVRLRGDGGHHVPHFHALGWMSSAYYARLPAADLAARERQEGWIHFGEPPAMFNLDLGPRRIVEPKEGRLVLFPSYMWHGTIPFGTGDRLTAAFDYQPL